MGFEINVSQGVEVAGTSNERREAELVVLQTQGSCLSIDVENSWVVGRDPHSPSSVLGSSSDCEKAWTERFMPDRVPDLQWEFREQCELCERFVIGDLDFGRHRISIGTFVVRHDVHGGLCG
jgi:hypothetical protein